MAAAAAAAAQGWSGLLEELVHIVMTALDAPDLVRSGAVCKSWHAAFSTVLRIRFPAALVKDSPCLLYACDAHGDDAAALYCPSTNVTIRVPIPEPRLSRRGLVGSAHGWLFTTDEVANPYLLNPVTGAQVALPPVTTIDCVKHSFFNDDGELVYNGYFTWPGGEPNPDLFPITAHGARDWIYRRVALSAGGASPACTVLIMHRPEEQLSFARPGDERWTLLSDLECSRFVKNITYNEKDGLFYTVCDDGSVHTLDLNGPSPVEREIMHASTRWANPNKYLVVAPSGELLQVWRIWASAKTPAAERLTYRRYQEACRRVRHRGLESYSEYIENDDDEPSVDIEDGNKVDEQLSDRNIDIITIDVRVYKVDVDRQRLVKLTGIGDHALFLGYNSAMCLPTKDFPTLKPNCAYLTDDCDQFASLKRGDPGVWDFKKRSLQKLGDVWPLHPWLFLPAPIWIKPSLF